MNFESLKAYIDTLPEVGIPFADCVAAQDHEIFFGTHVRGCNYA